MNMVDLYIAEVGKNLPAKNRADLEQEIRSLIEDAIDDAAQSQGREPNDDLVVEVLKKFGPPEQVAASYSKPRYLIGPRLYPTYWTVLGIVLAVVLVIAALGLGLDISQRTGPDQTPLQGFLEAGAGLLGSIIAAFGNVTLVFAILERLLPEQAWETEKEWDPRQMKAEPDPQQVRMVEPILGVFLTVAVLLVLNVYPQWIGISNFVNGQWVHAPVLAPAFFSYVPFMNVLLAAGVVQNALLLQAGRWTNTIRGLAIAIAAGSVILLASMLAGPNLVQFSAEGLSRLGWGAEVVDRIIEATPALTTLFRTILGLSLAGNLIEIGTQLYNIFKHTRTLKLTAHI